MKYFSAGNPRVVLSFLINPRRLFSLLFFVVLNGIDVNSASAEMWHFKDGKQHFQLEAIEPEAANQKQAKYVDLVSGRELLLASRLVIAFTGDSEVINNFISEDENTQLITQYPATESNHKKSKHVHQIWLINYEKLADTRLAMLRWQAKQKTNKNVSILVQPDLIMLRRQKAPIIKLHDDLQERSNSFDAIKLFALTQWHQFIGARRSMITVVDDGVFNHHPMFSKVGLVDSWDQDMEIAGAIPPKEYSHGTRVAALLWAPLSDRPKYHRNVLTGISPTSRMQAIKMTQPWTSNLLKSFARSAFYKSDVINVSWLSEYLVAPLKHYLDYLTTGFNNGVGIVVVAAGHNRYGGKTAFEDIANVIIVSALDYQDRLANTSFSERTDVATLGYVITRDTRADNSYSIFAKNSAATPIVTGYAAMIRARYPTIKPTEIKVLLRRSATRVCQNTSIGELCVRKLNPVKLLSAADKL